MKKITSILLALFSTLFLAVGATHAAEKFDTIGQVAKPTTFSGSDMPGSACWLLES